MQFLFVVMGFVESDPPAISGGDMRWLKFAIWLQKKGHTVHVLSTNACEKFIREYNSEIQFVSGGNLGPANLKGGIRRILRSLRFSLRGLNSRTLNTQYDYIYSVATQTYD